MNCAKGKLLGAMGIFGTIGLFVRFIPLPSSVIALCRAVLGLGFLILVMVLSGKRPDWTKLKKSILLLLLSGAVMGLNWLLLFESYRFTTVATATVCYYFAPLFLLLLSPLLGEKLTAEKLICILVALVGLVCVSGIGETGLPEAKELTGILLGISAAALYAGVMFMNKKLPPLPAYDKTVFQFLGAIVVLVPYVLLSETVSFASLTGLQWAMLTVIGIVHTGVTYTLYFGALEKLSAKTIGVLCYLDPVLAVILSALILKEPMRPLHILGTVLVLGSALYSELPKKRAPI